MKDLLKELDALEERIAKEQRTVDVCGRSLDEKGSFWREYKEKPERCEQLIGWLTELLEIKKARFDAEVLRTAPTVIETEQRPLWFDDVEELPRPCIRCNSQSGLTDRDGSLCCASCGAIYKDKP